MAKHYSITTRTSFDKVGKIGAILFVAAPFVSGLGFALSADRNPYSAASSSFPLLLMFVGTLALLIGFLMVLVGRRQEHWATEEDVSTSPLARLAQRR